MVREALDQKDSLELDKAPLIFDGRRILKRLRAEDDVKTKNIQRDMTLGHSTKKEYP